MSVAFRVEILDDILRIAHKATLRLVDKLEGVRGRGVGLDLCEEFRILTLRVIGEAVLGLSHDDSDAVFPKLYLPIMEEGNRNSLEPWRAYIPWIVGRQRERIAKLNEYIIGAAAREGTWCRSLRCSLAGATAELRCRRLCGALDCVCNWALLCCTEHGVLVLADLRLLSPAVRHLLHSRSDPQEALGGHEGGARSGAACSHGSWKRPHTPLSWSVSWNNTPAPNAILYLWQHSVTPRAPALHRSALIHPQSPNHPIRTAIQRHCFQDHVQPGDFRTGHRAPAVLRDQGKGSHSSVQEGSAVLPR